MQPESLRPTAGTTLRSTMNADLAATLERGLAQLPLELSSAKQLQLLQYVELIARWTRVYNLTAVRDPQEMLTQHLLDCLAVVAPLRREAINRHGLTTGTFDSPLRLLDVGSGAGLPGVILAIAQAEWQITCVDTVAKKAGFIRQVAAELNLPNLTATHRRVESMDEAPFDVITCRAFASLADFITLTRERLAPGGVWVAMKAKLATDEREAVPSDIDVFHVERLSVPGLDADRCLVWMRLKH